MSRPFTEIDWKKVDDLLVSGCPGTEIAGQLGIHPDTLYKHVEAKYKTNFSAYLREKRGKGDAMLRSHQFYKALGITEKGDNTLLIWLGKCRLKQKEHDDSQDTEVMTDTDKENRIMEAEAIIMKYQEKYGKLDDIDFQNKPKTESELS